MFCTLQPTKNYVTRETHQDHCLDSPTRCGVHEQLEVCELGEALLEHAEEDLVVHWSLQMIAQVGIHSLQMIAQVGIHSLPKRITSQNKTHAKSEQSQTKSRQMVSRLGQRRHGCVGW